MLRQSQPTMMPLDFIMGNWYPVLNGGWATWPALLNDLKKDGQLHLTAETVMRNGFVVVTLGGDGLVWLGQDEVVAAYMKGVRQLLCRFLFQDA